MQGISRVAEDLFASHEDLCCMELASYRSNVSEEGSASMFRAIEVVWADAELIRRKISCRVIGQS
jgi:hypothetical protein